MAAGDAGYEGFEVARWVDVLGGFINRRRRLWIALGNLETRFLADELSATEIAQPIYVAGVARAGSTILLESLAQHQELVTHRYRDYPPVFTPYWWNRFLERVPQHKAAPAERTHKDGIAITPDSPEAFEEVIWMAFFPELHDPSQSEVLSGATSRPEFEAFYRDHLRKLVRVRSGRRYLSKGNYNVTRLEYLLKLFPEARFVIPVREPVWHIASLMKQHALFCAGERRPRWWCASRTCAALPTTPYVRSSRIAGCRRRTTGSISAPRRSGSRPITRPASPRASSRSSSATRRKWRSASAMPARAPVLPHPRPASSPTTDHTLPAS